MEGVEVYEVWEWECPHCCNANGTDGDPWEGDVVQCQYCNKRYRVDSVISDRD